MQVISELAREAAAQFQSPAVREALRGPSLCPACEAGDHGADHYHAVFACACACNREAKQ